MRFATFFRSDEGGSSLVELMVSAAVATLILGGLITSGVALKNTYNACDEYYNGMSDQMRVLDNIALDMRRAISGNVSNTAQTLTLTLPNYLDTSGTNPTPRTPAISTSGVVSYGSGNPTVVYTLAGTSPNQTITRTYTPTTGAASTTTLTAATEDYAFTCVNPANTGSTANFSFGGSGQPSSVKITMTFKPRFNRLTLSSTRTATSASITPVLRNHL